MKKTVDMWVYLTRRGRLLYETTTKPNRTRLASARAIWGVKEIIVAPAKLTYESPN